VAAGHFAIVDEQNAQGFDFRDIEIFRRIEGL
jgi:hypothetical protein